jgi:hypothetical protein
MTLPAVSESACNPRFHGRSRIESAQARYVSVTPRRRTQILQLWSGRYRADAGGEFLVLVAAVMICFRNPM